MADTDHWIHRRVAVIGGGLLGIRIAGELALQGCTVHIYDHNPLTIQTIHSIIEAHFQELRDNNLLPTHLNIKGEVIADGLLSSAVADADIVLEAVNENISIKNSIFRDIASICSTDTLLCTSTLTLPMEDIFDGVPHRERTLGVRFLFPVYLIDSVEVSTWDATAGNTLEKIGAFLKAIKKKTFQREFGEYPRKLNKEEALENQKQFFCHKKPI
ncbi:uncharacterized protein LOC135348383 [Halichondria panicea]|uniref:uncharacterized protein LOC135348383 n=1 Tax=Halichondria panicea TaxID=6063 RepID=UPI00312B9F8F